MATTLARTLFNGLRHRPGIINSSLTRAFSSGIQLHYDWIRKSDNQCDHLVLFLHGLLGNGRNLRTMAKKLCEASNQPGILLDVRGHGNSKFSKQPHTPTDFHSCVQDLLQTLSAIPEVTTDTSITLVGHSLGGRISLQYAANAVQEPSEYPHPLNRVWLLDTVPEEANDSVERVVSAVTELSSEAAITDRKKMVEQLTSDRYKIDIGTAQWLGASLQKSKSDGGLEFGFDLTVVNDLLANFHHQDFMGLLKQSLESKQRVDLVRGGKNRGWTEARLDPLRELEDQFAGSMGVHLLPKAGHWVHVDDLPGLLEIMDISKK